MCPGKVFIVYFLATLMTCINMHHRRISINLVSVLSLEIIVDQFIFNHVERLSIHTCTSDNARLQPSIELSFKSCHFNLSHSKQSHVLQFQDMYIVYILTSMVKTHPSHCFLMYYYNTSRSALLNIVL